MKILLSTFSAFLVFTGAAFAAVPANKWGPEWKTTYNAYAKKNKIPDRVVSINCKSGTVSGITIYVCSLDTVAVVTGKHVCGKLAFTPDGQPFAKLSGKCKVAPKVKGPVA